MINNFKAFGWAGREDERETVTNEPSETARLKAQIVTLQGRQIVMEQDLLAAQAQLEQLELERDMLKDANRTLVEVCDRKTEQLKRLGVNV